MGGSAGIPQSSTISVEVADDGLFDALVIERWTQVGLQKAIAVESEFHQIDTGRQG
jgi:hypothetical protein